MKTLAKIGGTLIVILGFLFGTTLYTRNSSSELAGILDQFNPLVKETSVYVKTKEADSVNGYGTAHYKQIAVYEDGETRQIAFNGISGLKKDRYLRLTNKGAHVETYEEVSESDVPQKALQQLAELQD